MEKIFKNKSMLRTSVLQNCFSRSFLYLLHTAENFYTWVITMPCSGMVQSTTTPVLQATSPTDNNNLFQNRRDRYIVVVV